MWGTYALFGARKTLHRISPALLAAGVGWGLKCYCAYFVKESMAVHFNFPGMFKDSLLFNIPQHSVIARLFRMLTNRISPVIHMPIVHRVKTILPILRYLVHINWPLNVKKKPSSCRIYASYKSVITIFFHIVL